MKKRLMLLISVFAFILGMNSYSATCNNEEINGLSYEVMYSFNGLLADETTNRDRVILLIENVPEDMYVIVINNTTNEKKTYKEIENGMIEIETPNPNIIYDYTIKVYSSSTECENELLRTLNDKSIAYNSYSVGTYCMELIEKGEEFEGCETFTSKVYNDETFQKDLNNYLNKKPENVEEKLIDLFYKYYYFALIPIAILGVYYIIRLALIKRRKKKDEEQ